MKLKELRKHFREDGSNWVPKRSFRSIAAIKQAQLYSGRWEYYKCDFCNFYHVADKSKKDDDGYN